MTEMRFQMFSHGFATRSSFQRTYRCKDAPNCTTFQIWRWHDLTRAEPRADQLSRARCYAAVSTPTCQEAASRLLISIDPHQSKTLATLLGDPIHRRLFSRTQTGETAGAAAASRMYAGSCSFRYMTLSRLRSQWSSWKASTFSAERSKVATAARPQKEYVYAYTFVADFALFSASCRPCKASGLSPSAHSPRLSPGIS